MKAKEDEKRSKRKGKYECHVLDQKVTERYRATKRYLQTDGDSGRKKIKNGCFIHNFLFILLSAHWTAVITLLRKQGRLRMEGGWAGEGRHEVR